MNDNVIPFPDRINETKNKKNVELKLKIEKRIQVLEDMMLQNIHLDDTEFVKEHISEITKFWSILSEEDQEYCQVARHACDEGWSWK